MSSFGTYGNVNLHQRYIQPADSKVRRRCHCGCKKRAAFLGMANGVCLSMGCELSIRRWVRDGVLASSVSRRASLPPGEQKL